MKYVSLDLETTDVEPSPENILQISMVVEDTEKIMPLDKLPHFTCFVRHPKITGSHYALAMNAWILDYISGRKKNPPYHIIDGNEWVPAAIRFLNTHFGQKKAVMAGKNVGTFDSQFLPKELRSRFVHRMLDPGSTFVDWHERFPPDLATVKRKLGMPDVVAHDARADALDVIAAFRTQYVPQEGK